MARRVDMLVVAFLVLASFGVSSTANEAPVLVAESTEKQDQEKQEQANQEEANQDQGTGTPPSSDPADADSGEDPLAGMPGEDLIVTRGVTLEDALDLAFQNNLTLENLEMNVKVTDTGVPEALGAFDVNYYLDATGGQAKTPSANLIELGDFDEVALFTSKSDFLNIQTGFRGLTPLGLSYDISTTANRSYLSPSGFTLLNPSVRSDVTFSISQPLLRGFGTTVNKGFLYQARNDSRVSRLNLEQQMLQVGFAVINAYWQYVFTMKLVETKETAKKVAEELLDINRKKEAAGVFTYIDVVRAEDEVKRREEELIQARNNRGDAEDRLRRIIFPMDGTAIWNVRIQPLTEPAEPKPVDTDWERIANEAIRKRPDLEADRLNLQTLDIDIELAKNAVLPNLALRASYSLNGLGGNYGNSYDPIEDRDFRTFSLGIGFDIPIGNRTAEARLRRAELIKEQALVNLRDQEAQVVEEVRLALRSLDAGLKRIDATKESHRLANELYNKEKKRLDAGEGTPFLVREAERDLFVARDAELQALFDYQVALAELVRSRGTLLDVYGIVPPEPMERDDELSY